MLHLLPLSLAGSCLLFGWQRQRQQKPTLIEFLAPPGHAQRFSQRTLVAHLDDVTPEQNLVLSAGLLGMTTVGHLGVPLLRLLSTPGLCYLDLYFIRLAYLEWQSARQIGIATSDAVLATGLLVTRQWGADALFATLFFTGCKLQAKSAENLIHYLAVTRDRDEEQRGHPDVTLVSDTHAIQPANLPSANKPQWQLVIDQGALPLLVLGMVSMPLLGVKRALAVLLANFGYDYRVMAPLSTLSYLAVARENGIWLRDGQVLDLLQQADIFVLDVTWGEMALTLLQPGAALEVIVADPALSAPDKAALIAHLQDTGHRVVYYCPAPVDGVVIAQADVVVACGRESIAGVHVILDTDQPAQLQQLFDLRVALERNRKRGFYLALAPSLINLSGIYFYHFGVVTALLVDYGGATAGILNAMLPQLRLTYPTRQHIKTLFAPEKALPEDAVVYKIKKDRVLDLE